MAEYVHPEVLVDTAWVAAHANERQVFPGPGGRPQGHVGGPRGPLLPLGPPLCLALHALRDILDSRLRSDDGKAVAYK